MKNLIYKNLTSVAMFLLIAKIIGAFKEIVLAEKYGTNTLVDSYIYTLAFVNWPISLWFGVISVVLIPIIVKIHQRSVSDSLLFFRESLGLSVLTGVLFVIFTVASFSILDVNIEANKVKEIEFIKSYFQYLVFFGVVGATLSVWIMALGSNVNTLLEATPSFVLMIIILIPEKYISMNIFIGVVTGYSIHFLLLLLVVKNKFGAVRPNFYIKSTEWTLFFRSAGILALGQFFLGSSEIIDNYFASNFGHGAISSLSYGNRIVSLLTGLVSVVILRAMLPVFSKEDSDRAEIISNVFYWSKIIFIVGIILAVIVQIFSHELVSLLFERGSFTIEDTLKVVEIVQYGIIQVPFFGLSMIFVSYFASRLKYKVILYSAILAVSTKILLNYILIDIVGLAGVALSWTGVYLLNSIFFYVYFIIHQRESISIK